MSRRISCAICLVSRKGCYGRSVYEDACPMNKQAHSIDGLPEGWVETKIREVSIPPLFLGI